MKAVLVFKLHVKDLMDLHDFANTRAVQACVIEKDKSVKIITKENVVDDQVQYISVGPPQVVEETVYGSVKTEIELIDVLKGDKGERISLIKGAMIESSYFDNEKLEHALTLTQ